MGSKHRRCDARCHDAARQKCACWCGGIFHGAAGRRARQAFVDTYGRDIPAESPELSEPLLHWHAVGSTFTRAMTAARRAFELDQVDDQVDQVDEGAAA